MKPSELSFDPGAAGWCPVEDSGFIGLAGPFWQRREEGGLAYAFLAQDKHHNRRGVVQGGMLATLLDRAVGINVSEANGGRPQATVQLDLHYLDAVRIGEFVEARCRIERQTRSLTFAAGEARVGSRLVVTARGVWKMLGVD